MFSTIKILHHILIISVVVVLLNGYHDNHIILVDNNCIYSIKFLSVDTYHFLMMVTKHAVGNPSKKD